MRFIIRIDGKVKVKWHGQTVADAGLRDGRLAMEVGIKLDPDGTPRIVQWVPEKPFDIDLDNTVIAAVVLATGIVGGISAIVISEYIEGVVNKRVAEGAADLFDDPALAPGILMTMFGTHLTRLPVRFEGADILFEHIAPLEPDPQPRQGYAGAIGRTVLMEALGHATFMPRTLDDTWAADNLKSKIDHIVVVMMENRSYDHVLGYRAQRHAGEDGLTGEVIAAVNSAFPVPPSNAPQRLPGTVTAQTFADAVRPLRKSAFPLNARNLRTRIPKGVGHDLADVRQQLSGQIEGPGRRINDPRRFVDNFRDTRLGGNPVGADGSFRSTCSAITKRTPRRPTPIPASLSTICRSTASSPKTTPIAIDTSARIPVRRCPTGCSP